MEDRQKAIDQKKRLEQLVIHLRMNLVDLAKLAGLNKNTIYHVGSGVRGNMSEKTAARIEYNVRTKLGVFVNKEWLLEGVGEMIVENNSSDNNITTQPVVEKKQQGKNTEEREKKVDSEGPFIESTKRTLTTNYNLVLTGAPGTGKTTLAQKIAEKMGAETMFVQFHPSYDYTDFVEGLRPIEKGNGEMGFERKDGVFKAFCKKAIENSQKKFVCIIDEINRGEASKIFGELFYAIDPGYRGKNEQLVQTQYQNLVSENDVFAKGFYVPKNVYILATMNDIDRSVESMDFAMRRRFTWKEVTPDDTQYMLDKEIRNYAHDAKAAMKRLNEVISSTDGLGAAYSIGPSYFLKLELYGGDFYKLWTMNIEPLLKEYLRGFRKAKETLEKFRKAYNNEEEKQEFIDEN